MPQRIECVVSGPTRPETERARQEILLVDRLQQHHHGALKHLVGEGRNPDGSTTSVGLRDVRAADRWGAIAAGFCCVEKALEIFLQVFRELRGRLTIDPCSAILARPSVRLAHPGEVHVVGECREHEFRLAPGQVRYSPTFR
jgi:hypothetical protein